MSHLSNQTQTRAALLQNTISLQESPIPVLIHPLNSQNLRQIQTTNSDIVAVTYEGSIQFHTRGSLEAPPRTLSFPIKFKQIACGSACVIMLSHQGQVYSYGEDPQKFGLMCQEASYSIKLPTRVEALEEIMITQISVGTSHAAAIDISGQLYTWGTGEFGQLGTQKISKGVNVVESARIFTVKQVECGDTFTCLCTRGGYAYIYGTLGGHYNRNRLTGDTLMKRLIQTQAVNRSMQSPKRESASNQPLTIQSLSQHFVNYIAAGLNFVCVLTDTGSVYVFDDCLELVKLPISGDTTMQSIAVCGDVVYGITKNHRYLYKWGSPSLDPSENLGSARKQCQLFSWPGSVFELGAMYKEECHIFGSYKGWAAILFESREIEAQAIGEYLSHIEPYKRATFSMNPVESVYDSLDVNSFTLKMPSLDRSFISTVHSRRSQSPELITQIELESLLNDDMPFEKMLSIRMEFEQRQYLTKAFVPLFYPLLEGAFDKIRNYSNQVRIYQRSIAQTFMPNVLSKKLLAE